MESKAHGRGKPAAVPISSEHQLESNQAGTLYLIVTIFDYGSTGEQLGESVTHVAKRVRAKFAASNERALGRFDALLEAAGLSMDDDYSAWSWLETAQSIFHVQGGFPRLTPSDLPVGLSNLRYDLWLPACVEYMISKDSFELVLEGVAHG